MQNNKVSWFSKSGLAATALILLAELTAIPQVLRAEANGIDLSSTFASSTYFPDRKLAQGASIEGEWNLEQAQQIILPRIKSHKWKNGETVHKIISQYKLPYKNKEARLVATGSMRESADCHGCGQNLSFFEFEKRTTGWKLVKSYIDTVAWGTWGKVEPSDIKVKTIGNNGDNIYGIMLDGNFTQSGVLSTWTSIYAKVGGSMREILHEVETSIDNGGMGSSKKISWDSKVTIQQDKSSKGFFNILVSSKGIRDNKSFSEKKIFKFNGQKYVSSK
jgi:hypothetical protein